MKDKRRSILESAEHEFLEKGYEGTSIDSIVKDAGGSKSTIYAYFPDKAVLFAETLGAIQRDLDFSLPHAAPEEAVSLREALVRLGVEFLTVIYSERALHLMRTVIAESSRFPEVARQLMDEGFAVAIGRIAAYLERADAEGIVSVPDSGRSAREFVALLRTDRHLRVLLGVDPIPDGPAVVADSERATTAMLALLRV